ncbi:hypothetical protein FB451DRAFT_1394316 [Mycena latifolia]|nr:hypothetical protein FB451DRAFT_1394316 [Mycena latifolia]
MTDALSHHHPYRSQKRLCAQPFRFRGDRLQFLEDYVNDYLAACDAAKNRYFWPPLAAYWARFPWTLPMEGDPHSAMRIDDPEADFRPEDYTRERIEKLTTHRIKRFFAWKRQRYHRANVQ